MEEREGQRKRLKTEPQSQSQHPQDPLCSPPLRLKIKMTPEIAKSLTTPPLAPRPRPPAPPRPYLPPLVESLGVDVPSPHQLALLNRLHHASDALARGSVLRRPQMRSGYRCAVCGKREEARARFLEHIVQHTLEGSCQCKECGASFAVEPSWRKHLLLIHGVKSPGLEELVQELVQEEEEGEGELVIDTGEEEEEEGGIGCAGCQERFSSQTGLEGHHCTGS